MKKESDPRGVGQTISKWLLASLATVPIPLIWDELKDKNGLAWAIILLAILSLVATAMHRLIFGGPWHRLRITMCRIIYPFRMTRWKAMELLRRGAPGSGRGNVRYSTYEKFVEEDQRRSDRRQIDFGVSWSEGQLQGFRVTWHEATGELAAVGASENEPVEVIATIASEFEVLHRLANHEYAYPSLRWLRRRAYGWPVPLPPRGNKWFIEYGRKPDPRPTPPAASVHRKVGAYLGQKGAGPAVVLISDPEGQRPLYHYFAHSPTGFSWGYSGEGPHDLARSILADRLGWVPNMLIYSEFCNDIIYHLSGGFVLKFDEVDKWIQEHGRLIGRNPKADFFDPATAPGYG